MSVYMGFSGYFTQVVAFGGTRRHAERADFFFGKNHFKLNRLLGFLSTFFHFCQVLDSNYALL